MECAVYGSFTVNANFSFMLEWPRLSWISNTKTSDYFLTFASVFFFFAYYQKLDIKNRFQQCFR